MKNFFNNLFLNNLNLTIIVHIVIGIITSTAFIYYVLKLETLLIFHVQATLTLMIFLFIFSVTFLIAFLYVHAQFKKNTIFKPHYAGFLQKDNFYYCQNHTKPALLALSEITKTHNVFNCPICNNKWTMLFRAGEDPSLQTHADFCKAPIIKEEAAITTN